MPCNCCCVAERMAAEAEAAATAAAAAGVCACPCHVKTEPLPGSVCGSVLCQNGSETGATVPGSIPCKTGLQATPTLDTTSTCMNSSSVVSCALATCVCAHVLYMLRYPHSRSPQHSLLAEIFNAMHTVHD